MTDLAPTVRSGAMRPRRSPLRRMGRLLSWLLLLAGVLMLADVGVTMLWQEPVTAVIGMIKRSEIDKRFLSYHTAPLSALDQRQLAALSALPRRIAYLARRENRVVPIGAALGRLSMPKIGASYLFVQGTTEPALEKGPGHYPSTGLPGLGRTVAIAGHRTTYLAPFRHIDQLRPGDRIILTMPYGRFVYRVQFTRVVPPNAWWITRNKGYDRLVLSACNPVFSAAQRIAVFARLSQSVPLGPARRAGGDALTRAWPAGQQPG